MESERANASCNQSNWGRYPKQLLKKKNSRYDNQPYGKILPIVKENMFKTIRTTGLLLDQWNM
jgi:hypothetical protein